MKKLTKTITIAILSISALGLKGADYPPSELTHAILNSLQENPTPLFSASIQELDTYQKDILQIRKQKQNPHLLRDLEQMLRGAISARNAEQQAPIQKIEEHPYHPNAHYPAQGRDLGIIHLGAVELSKPKITVKATVPATTEDLMRAQQYSGENIEHLLQPKNVVIETIAPKSEITKRQISSQCGLAAAYNAVQLYNLLNKKITQSEFEKQMRSFDPESWREKVQQMPLDEGDMLQITLSETKIPENQITVIPNLVDRKYNPSFVPFLNRLPRWSPSEYTIGFENERTLLNAIESIRNPRIEKYTHIFFLNDRPEVHQTACAGHWITTVLNKDHGKTLLFIANSANDYYGQNAIRLDGKKDDMVDLGLLKTKVDTDMKWINALVVLLNTSQDALKLGLELVTEYDLENKDNYTVKDLERVTPKDSIIGDQLRALTNPGVKSHLEK